MRWMDDSRWATESTRLVVGCLLFLSALIPLPGHGQEKTSLFIDEVRFKGAPFSMKEQVLLWGSALAVEVSGVLRDVDRFTPMTLQNLESQLGKEERKATLACADASCINRIVENFGISESVFGVVTWLGRKKVQVSLVHTAGDEKVGEAAPRYAAPEYDAIAQALRVMAGELFGVTVRSAGGMTIAPPPVVDSGGPVIESGTVTAAVADVAILAEPKDLVRLEITDPKGKNVVSGSPYKNRSAAPGSWKVSAKAAGYEEYEGTFSAAADDVTVHRIELKALGGLEVTGEPAGAAVTVTGPGGFRHSGGLPWKAQGLRSGKYAVEVSREGYRDLRQAVVVRPGGTARVPVDLLKGSGASPGGAGTGKTGIEWVFSKPSGVSFARSETTVSQYRACVKAGKCEAKHHKDKSEYKYCNWGYGDRDDHPMNCVDWYGAEQFCEWAEGRLPTAQEWEAEAGSSGSREFPWGAEKPSCSRCVMDDGGIGCGKGHTWPVCSKRLGDSVSGLCDMAGNVWEWTSSQEGSTRVLRGGSWNNAAPGNLRASSRFRFDPDFGFSFSGFRCVRSSQ